MVLAAIASVSHAEIVKDSYWESKHDFTSSNVGVEVIDGIVFGTSDSYTQRI